MENFDVKVEYFEYVVKKGDSLYTIAKEYSSSVQELSDVNMLTSTVIYPGQILLIPKKQKTNVDYYFDTYITKDGDTIEEISKKLGVEKVTIGMYNDFSKVKLEKDQELVIPFESVYIVKDDDTIDSILEKTNRSAKDLLKSNRSWYVVGSKIYL